MRRKILSQGGVTGEMDIFLMLVIRAGKSSLFYSLTKPHPPFFVIKENRKGFRLIKFEYPESQEGKTENEIIIW